MLVNGVESARLEVLDRGLQYGDGLFETIAWTRGSLRLWRLHLERLQSGCDRLGLPMPDGGVLEAEVRALVGSDDAVVKVMVTRGVSERGYRAPQCPVPTRIVAVFPWPQRLPEWQACGLRLRTCRTPIGLSPALAGLKHLGRLEQVLARSEWHDDSFEEGLMLDPAGNVVCATQANVFVALRGELLTPRIDRAGVAGVMRRAVLEWSGRVGVASREVLLRPGDLLEADEAFLTSAVLGACPVSSIDGRRVPQGRIARDFQAWLAAV